jgi:pyridoxine kinase
MNILSIQSGVVYGHVGNAAAQFCLQRMGHDVWRIDTVRFSNHPGHRGMTGSVAPAAEIATLVEGVAARGWLAQCDAVITGYLGAADQGPVALAAAERVRAANARALWLLDPVIGDHGRVFVKPGIPEFIRDIAAPRANILTPNAFELAWLTGRPIDSRDDAIAAAEILHGGGTAPGPRIVLATGVPDGPESLATIAIDGASRYLVTTPRLATCVHGTGDSLAALFLGALLDGKPLDIALAHAVSALHQVLSETAARGALELALVPAQAALVAPSPLFRARPVTTSRALAR